MLSLQVRGPQQGRLPDKEERQEGGRVERRGELLRRGGIRGRVQQRRGGRRARLRPPQQEARPADGEEAAASQEAEEASRHAQATEARPRKGQGQRSRKAEEVRQAAAPGSKFACGKKRARVPSLIRGLRMYLNFILVICVRYFGAQRVFDFPITVIARGSTIQLSDILKESNFFVLFQQFPSAVCTMFSLEKVKIHMCRFREDRKKR